MLDFSMIICQCATQNHKHITTTLYLMPVQCLQEYIYVYIYTAITLHNHMRHIVTGLKNCSPVRNMGTSKPFSEIKVSICASSSVTSDFSLYRVIGENRVKEILGKIGKHCKRNYFKEETNYPC